MSNWAAGLPPAVGLEGHMGRKGEKLCLSPSGCVPMGEYTWVLRGTGQVPRARGLVT